MERGQALALLLGGMAGVREFSQRKMNGEVMPNLEGLDLSGADLKQYSVWEETMAGVDLSGLNLRKANLAKTDLREADLKGTDLTGATLAHSALVAADFRLAVLRQVDVNGADFDQAHMHQTVLANLNLSNCVHLETIRHWGPSTIGTDTLFASGGKIPEAFLRGVGVSDEIIAYLLSLFASGNPIDFYSCFISYSHVDEEFAQRLFSRLRDSKLRVWFAREEMKGGRKLYDQIDQAIRVHDKLLLVLSDQSIRSEWVMTEIRRARQREVKEKHRVLFPIRLTDMTTLKEWTCFDADIGKDLAVEAREYYIPDFSNWKDHDSFEKAFERLLKDLRKSEENNISAPR